MTTSRRRLALFIAVPLLLLFLPLSIYFVDSAAASDKVARNVSIEGTDVSRYTEQEAAAVVDTHADTLASTMITVEINGHEFTLDPADVGVAFARDEAISQAMSENKDGLSGWIRAFSTEVDVPIHGTIDQQMLNKVIAQWERDAIPNPAFEGAVTITGQTAKAEYPHAGVAVDRDIAYDRISEAITTGSTTTVELVITDSEPTLTNADIDQAAERAQTIIDRGVVLTNDDYGFEFIVNTFNMARALSVEVITGKPSTIEFVIDAEVIASLAETQRGVFEVPPVDATWEIVLVDDHEPWDENYEITDSPLEDVEGLPENDTIELIPSRMGTHLNVDLVVEAAIAAAFGDGTGELELEYTVAPEFTTEDALAYGELYEVSEFTTYKPGVNRAHNIDLMADTIDGHIVWPGETFSINEFIGRRTLEKGYKYDCAIVSGELSCEDDPVNGGGGVSQFGTTLFNAVFFACLEDVDHRPHSLYFTRYPMGREATLGVPGPDVKFRNNTDSPVVIKTAYTDTSITVKMYGDNGGLTCTDVTYEPTDIVEFEEELVADTEDEVTPGERRLERSGINGFFVRVDRVVTRPDGSSETDLELSWRYRPLSEQYIVHPCEVTGEPVDCPVELPSMSNKTWDEALAELEALGLLAARIEGFVDDPAKDGVVLAQDPAPGTWLPKGTTVKLTVGVFDEG